MAAEKNSPVIFSTSEKITLSKKAAFGDVHDLFVDEKTAYDGPICYTVHTRRKFVEGDYRLHMVDVEEQHCSAIICHDSIDPAKIHELLSNSNTGSNFRNHNYLSKYDWMHYANYGEVVHYRNTQKFFDRLGELYGIESELQEDENVNEDNENEEDDEDDYLDMDTFKRFILFVDASEMDSISSGEFSVKSTNEWVSILQKEAADEEEKPIGFIIDNDCIFIKNKWRYGCVLVDAASQRCFAFVLEDFYTTKAALRKRGEFVNIVSSNYTYSMKDFEKN